MMSKIRKYWKRLTFLGVTAIGLLYVGSYTVLSTKGEYGPASSGYIHFWSGGTIYDLKVWNPKGVKFAPNPTTMGLEGDQRNFLGHLYRPLLSIDRTHFHRTWQYEHVFPETRFSSAITDRLILVK